MVGSCGGRSCVQGIQCTPQAFDILLEAEIADDLKRRLSHGGCQRGIVEKAPQSAAESFDIFRRVDKTVYAIVYQIGRTADLVGNDHCAPGIHDLIHDESPWLMNGRKNKYIAEIEKRRQLALVFKAEQTDMTRS